MTQINVKLEKFTTKDFSNYFSLVNNEKVMEMITERAIEWDEAQKDFKKLIDNNQISEDFGCFRILDAVNNGFIGLAKLEIKNKSSKEAELGYMILPQYWGNGIASKVGKHLIKIAKKHPFLKMLFAIIDPKNLASRRILINNGFISKEFKDFDGLSGEVLELELN